MTRLKVDAVQPFVRATREVFQGATGVETKVGRPAAKKGPIPIRGVAVVVGVTGDLEGRVVLDMSRKTATAVASAMMGEKLLGYDMTARSAVSELGNMIAGRAVTYLVDAGYRFDITPPTVVSGSDLELFSADDTPTLVIPVVSDLGEIEVNLSLHSKD